MVRTQIQLTPEQSEFLKEMALKQGISVAELIRQSVDNYIRSVNRLSLEEKRARALAMVGVASSGMTDLGEAHDRYLAEAYEDVKP